MSKYARITAPDGERIQVDAGGTVQTPDRPIIAFIEGDGTGPDIWRAARTVFDAGVRHCYGSRRAVAWMEVFAGEKGNSVCGSYLPEETIEAIREYHVAIKGPLTTPVGGGFRSLNVTLRQTLDLFACVRPIRWFEGVPSPVRCPEQVNMVVFRENTEDVYAGFEVEEGSEAARKFIAFAKETYGWGIRADSGIGFKPISIAATKRIVRAALKYALKHGRKSVTLVHKGNIMKYTEGAFRKWGYQLVKEEFADVAVSWEGCAGNPGNRLLVKDTIADIFLQQVLTRPLDFDVIATMNLNGDYMSDALAAQVGGIGIAPGANINYETGAAIFEATHGTAPKYANQDKVNPSSLILSGLMMFDHLGWTEVGEALTAALVRTFKAKTVTYDLARLMEGAKEVKCSEFGKAIIANL
jgi:isocitrate dehydrogenase